MFKNLLNTWKTNRNAWKGLRAFNQLPSSQKQFVFYAESAADWAFLEPVVAELKRRTCPVVLICSDPDDPALDQPQSFYVGSGTPRTVLFRTIEAERFIMTLPDIETFHLKRSVHPVHYIYIFHSIASTHRVYRLHAFDAYDTILCVGSHHEREIRKTEEVYGLPPKRLLPHGYGRLDTLLHDLHREEGKLPASPQKSSSPLRVLLSPTWGDCSLVQYGLESLIRILLDAGFLVTLRLHPMTKRHRPSLASNLEGKFGSSGRFAVDPVTNATQSLLDADIMVSEWSGSPLEYAFARLRPVIFIDTPPKIHNPEYDRLELPCLEDDIRKEIGAVVPQGQFDRIPNLIRELVGQADEWKEKIRAVRDRTVYHIGSSAKAAANVILNASPLKQEELNEP